MKSLVHLTFIVIGAAAIAACSDGVRDCVWPSALSSGLSEASPGARGQTVVGSAEVTQMPGMVYRQTIDARRAADGQVSGTLTVQIEDMSAWGLTGKYTVVSKIDCLEFDGASVWFGAQPFASNDPQFLQLGPAIGKIEKKSGQDFAFSGPAKSYLAPGTACGDRPDLVTFAVSKGQYTLR
jgi:hypothetical protein